MTDTMTIAVHGTFSKRDPWTLPSNRNSLHNFLQSTIFPADFMVDDDADIFIWDAEANNDAREVGVVDLEAYCLHWRDKLKKQHNLTINAFRLVGHSHGATVANGVVARLAKHGFKVKSLINLAVPVRFEDTTGLSVRCNPLRECYPPEHKPDLAHVDGCRVFVFYATNDTVVTQLAFAQQDFTQTPITGTEVVHVRTRPIGIVRRHWLPTVVECWTEEHWDQISF